MSAGEKFRIKFNCDARDAQSLSVKRGDIVTIVASPAELSQGRPGAHYVQIDNTTSCGFVQLIYLSPLANSSPPSTAGAVPMPAVMHSPSLSSRDVRQSWSPSGANAAAIQYALKHGGAAPPDQVVPTPARSNSGNGPAMTASPAPEEVSSKKRGSYIAKASAAAASSNLRPPSGSPVAQHRRPSPIKSSVSTPASGAGATAATAPATSEAASSSGSSIRVAGIARVTSSGGVGGRSSYSSALGSSSSVPSLSQSPEKTATKSSQPPPPSTQPVQPPPPTAQPSQPPPPTRGEPRFRPNSSTQTSALKEKLMMGGGTSSNETSPRVVAKQVRGTAAKGEGAVHAASQMFEQMGLAHVRLSGAALPAAWTSSRRSSPVTTPREDYKKALPEEESSSDSDSAPLPPPNAMQLTKPIASRQSDHSGPNTARSNGSGGKEDEDSGTGSQSHSRFDVSELQELKRRLQAKKVAKDSITVHAIEYIKDDAELDELDDAEKATKVATVQQQPKSDAGDSSDDGELEIAQSAPTGSGKRKSRKRQTKDSKGVSSPMAVSSSSSRSKMSSSSSSKNNLSLRRRKASTETAPEPLVPDDSPRKVSSSHERPSRPTTIKDSSNRSRKVRTLPRPSPRGNEENEQQDSGDESDTEEDDAKDAANGNDDDVWAKLIAAEKAKQLKREKHKKTSGVDANEDDDDGVADENKEKSGSLRRKDRTARRGSKPRSSAPKFDQVFAAVEDSSTDESPRDKLASLGFIADESDDDAGAAAVETSMTSDEFGALFQEDPDAPKRGVQFKAGTKTEATGEPTTRARSKSVSERVGKLQPVTLGAIKEKHSAAAAAAVAAATAMAASAAAATTVANANASTGNLKHSGERPVAAAPGKVVKVASTERPKVCQHCVAMAVATPGKVAARVFTSDGVELFLCKSCTREYQARDGSNEPALDASPPNGPALAASAHATPVTAPTAATSQPGRGGGAENVPPQTAPTASVAAPGSPVPSAGGRFLSRLKSRVSGRYKLQRDAEGNVVTIETTAGVAVLSRGSSSAQTAEVAKSHLSSASKRADADDDDQDEDGDLGDSGRSKISANRLKRELASVQTRQAIGFDIGRRTDDIVVVIDPGSATTKIGFSGEVAPRAVLPTWVRYMEQPKKNMAAFGQAVIPIAQGSLPDRPGFIGEDPSVPKLRSTWKHPVERGVVRDWDEMEKILEYSFECELKADPEDHPVIMTDGSPLSDRLQRERAVQIMFETFNVPSTYLALQSAMSMLACGDLTGLVVTIGDGVTCAVPIYEGFPIRHSIHTLDRAGADLTTHFVDLVNDAMQASEEWAKLAPNEAEQLLFDSTSHSDRYQFEQLKRKYCYVARQSLVSEEKMANESRYKYEKQWTSGDGRRLSLLHERYLACEPLFEPSRIGGAEMHWLDETGVSTERRHVNCEGIHRLAYASIRKCDKSVRKTLLNNVYLAGGSSRITGICERMAAELKAMVAGSHLSKAKINVSGGPATDEYSEWLGASMFASLSSFASASISRDEYLEVGPPVVHRRCL